MKPEDFETKLKRQPMRQIPSRWRVEILSTARNASQVPHVSRFTFRASWLSTLNSQLSTFLWPHPRAWAGLAAVWLAILAINFATRGKADAVATRKPLTSPEVIITWKEQQRLLAELIGPMEVPVANRLKSSPPRPRSERYNETSMV